MLSETNNANQTQDEVSAITNWLKGNSIQLQHIEARSGFEDLKPLKPILSKAKVVGLGETTHGTHEIYQLKHRLVEFLVVELDFNVIAFEASFSACNAINDYVLYGKGDLSTAVTEQGYVVWDIEEFVDLVKWLREHNNSVPEDKKVQFHGLDLWGNEWGRCVVLDYLNRVALDRVEFSKALFDAIADEEAKWPTFIDDKAKHAIDVLLLHVQSLMSEFESHKEDFIRKTSIKEFDHAYQYLRVMQQWLIQNGSQQRTNASRSTFMAENLVYLADRASADAKFIVWEHNDHIGKGYIETDESNMGQFLQHRYGDHYFAIGFEFGHGTFNTREILPDHHLGDFREISLDQPPEGSLPWYLSRLDLGNLILNLRSFIDESQIDRWLRSSVVVHQVSWVSTSDSKFNSECKLLEKYDAIAYIEQTTAARPTTNGLKTIAARRGL